MPRSQLRPLEIIFSAIFIAILCFNLLQTGQFGIGIAHADSPTTIQPSTKDNYISQAVPTTNYGTTTYLLLRPTTSYLINFELEFPITWGTTIPAGAIISSAVLSIYYYYYLPDSPYLNPSGRTLGAYRLLRLDWVEAEATYNIYKTGSNWTTAGCASDGNDYTSTNGATSVIPGSYGWMTWDITEQVKTAQTGNINVGCLIKDTGTTASYYLSYFYSGEYAVDTTKCPKLVITYTLPTLTIHTDIASGVDKSSATLNGEITIIAGTPDYYAFVYGTSSLPANPGNVSPADAGYTSNWVSGSGSYGVAAYNTSVSLAAATQYYFRFAAHDSVGWTYGDELGFQTLRSEWLSGYSYSKMATVPQTSGAGANYTVPFKLYAYTAGNDTDYIPVGLGNHSSNFPFDVRFTGYDGTILQDQWIEDIDAYIANNGLNTAGSTFGGAYTYPSAYYFSGTYNRTYAAYLGGNGTGVRYNDPFVIYKDENTGAWSTPVQIGTNDQTSITDAHGTCSVAVDNSGYILVTVGHATRDDSSDPAKFRLFRSKNPEDIGSSSSDWDLLNNDFIQETAEYVHFAKDKNGDIYAIYSRDNHAEYESWLNCIAYMKSSDVDPKGDTWSAEVVIADYDYSAPLSVNDCRIYIGGTDYDATNDRIGIPFAVDTYEDPVVHVRQDIEYVYLKIASTGGETTGHLYSAAGVDLGTSLNKAEMDSSDCIAIDTRTAGYNTEAPFVHFRPTSHYPIISYCRQIDASPNYYLNYYQYFIYWTGAAWSDPVQLGYTNFWQNSADFVINGENDVDFYSVSDEHDISKYNWNGSTLGSQVVLFPQTSMSLADVKAVVGRVGNSTKVIAEMGTSGSSLGTDTNGVTKAISFDSQDKLSARVLDYAKFWVEVAGNLTASSQNIYLYYGSESVTYTVSSGNSTFPFYEHFNTLNHSASWTETGEVDPLERSSVLMTSGDILESVDTFAVGYTIWASFRMSSGVSTGIGFGHSGDADNGVIFLEASNFRDYVYHDPNATYHNMLAHDHLWHKALIARPTTALFKAKIDSGSFQDETTNLPVGSLTIDLYAASATMEVDFVIVRKFVYPEPSSGTVFTEENFAWSVSPSSHNFGIVQPSSTYWPNGAEPSWPLGESDCWGNLTNSSSFAIDILISMSPMIGDTTWNNGSSPDSDVFTCKAGISGTANIGNFTTLSGTPVAFITNMAAGNVTKWTFVFYPPTNYPSTTDDSEHSGNITLAAEVP